MQAQPIGIAWTPIPDRDGKPSPQRLAYESKADVVGYGGAAGGGKTDLALGLAGTAHWRSIIFRREFPLVRAVIERSREIYNAADASHAKDSYNEQLHLWRLHDGRQVEFGAMQYEGDKENFQGRPHDLYAFDEATQFSESQIRFVTAWNRSTHIDKRTGTPQRCRVVLTFNPPMSESGDWITRFFLPWLAYLYPAVYQHPNPAKPGELRWYATIDGEEREIADAELQWYAQQGGEFWQVDSAEPFLHHGTWIVPQRGFVSESKLVGAKSRTFIPATLADNPLLEATGYGATIDALPEPMRSLLKGNFNAARVVDPWQVIPAAWVRAAQERWRKLGKPAVPLQATGVDVARGGQDKTVIARWYGDYCGSLDKRPGVTTPNGASVAQLLTEEVTGGVPIGVDIIGVGGSSFDVLTDLEAEVTGVNFAEAAPEGARDKSGKLKFRNLRAYCYWKLREALDPEGDEQLALPDDPELLADLCAPRWSLTAGGILIESKEEIQKRIGRSPDCGDSVVIGHYTLKHYAGSWLLWGE